MADDIEKLSGVKRNTVKEDVNKNISDPEILEAIMASLKEAEDALEGHDDDQDKLGSEDQVEETVEITKMDVKTDEDSEILNGFVFSDITDSSSPTKAMEDKVDDGVIVNGCEKQEDLKPVTRKRKKCWGLIRAPLPLKKARGRPPRQFSEKRESCDESFSEEKCDSVLTNGDTDYKPRKKHRNVLPRSKKSSSKKVAEESVLFVCDHCTFQSDIVGELKIHRHNIHEGCEAPSYLDMSEAAVAKLEDSSGVVEMCILKEVLFDNFDSIVEDKSSASELLSQALRAGVKLGRLQMSRKGRGKERFRVVNKEKMKVVVEKWRLCKESVELDFCSKPISKKKIRNVKKNVTRRRSNKVKVILKKDVEEYDSDIAVLDESLTTTTKLRLMRKKISVPQPKVQIVQCLPQSFIPQSPLSSGRCEDYSNDLLTCPVCYFSFWYEYQTVEHMRSEHGDECAESLPLNLTIGVSTNVENAGEECEELLGQSNCGSELKHLSDNVEKREELEQEDEVKFEERDENGNISDILSPEFEGRDCGTCKIEKLIMTNS